jgi:hypothetical protein
MGIYTQACVLIDPLVLKGMFAALKGAFSIPE